MLIFHCKDVTLGVRTIGVCLSLGSQEENASETSVTWNTLALTLSFLFLRLRSARIVVIEIFPQQFTFETKPSQAESLL